MSKLLYKRRFLLSFIFYSLTACTSSSLLLVNTLAAFDDYQVYENLVYGKNELNRLDIYTPRDQAVDRATKLPVVIFFYGGCWGGCQTWNKENYAFVAQALTSQGYISVLTDYRRYPQVTFPAIIDDARRSVEWVKANIRHFGGDPDKMFLMGHSAGAHLAAMLSVNESYLQPQTFKSIKGFIGLAGPYDFLPFTEPYQKQVFGPEKNYPASQPINFVNGNEPPMLLLYGNRDETVKPHNIKSLADKVRNYGRLAETRYYDDIDHTFLLGALSIPYQQNEPVLGDIVHFLNQQRDFQYSVAKHAK